MVFIVFVSVRGQFIQDLSEKVDEAEAILVLSIKSLIALLLFSILTEGLQKLHHCFDADSVCAFAF